MVSAGGHLATALLSILSLYFIHQSLFVEGGNWCTVSFYTRFVDGYRGSDITNYAGEVKLAPSRKDEIERKAEDLTKDLCCQTDLHFNWGMTFTLICMLLAYFCTTLVISISLAAAIVMYEGRHPSLAAAALSALTALLLIAVLFVYPLATVLKANREFTELVEDDYLDSDEDQVAATVSLGFYLMLPSIILSLGSALLSRG